MATVLSTLYPPLIDTFMPAFPYTGPASVSFSISPYNSWQEIKYMHVTLVNQKTNQNAFMSVGNTEDIPLNTFLWNGIWIVPFSPSALADIFTMDTANNQYILNIPASLLKNQIKVKSEENNTKTQKTFVWDYYYKVQIRFDCCTSDTPNNAAYLTKNRAFFSEWSSVCLLKAIPNIKLHLNNFTLESTAEYGAMGLSIINELINKTETKKIPQYVPGIIPFSGNLTFETSKSSTGANVATTSGSEYLQSYSIKVYDNEGNLFSESEKIYTANKNELNSFYWLCDMTNGVTDTDYTVSLTFTTNNQYTFTRNFQFRLIDSSPIEFTPIWDFNKRTLPENGINKKVLVTSEDGLVTITITIPQTLPAGYLFIRRASSKDNYKSWTLIDCTYTQDGDKISKTFVDKTVTSLVGYKYSCQYLTQKGSWTKISFTDEIVYPDFYDILISRKDKQLAIRYNEQIATMTPVVNRIKIDTLGGKYPKFAENAKLNYKQFNLTGLIIAEGDYNRQFISDLNYSNQMKEYDDNIGGAYAIRNDTIREEFTDSKINGTYTVDINRASTYIEKRKRDTQKNTYHDLYPMDNWWWEREFREEVIKWLNDGEPKLYRSMTEGNMIVMFNDISLTPNMQLGRRVWNFSATVYEIGDGYSLEQLDALGIFPIRNDYATNLLNGNQEDTTITRKYIGQQYQVTDTASGGGGTKITIDGLIQDQLNWLYTGLYKNFKLDSTSIKLYNVKIQFDSLPQWYNLDTFEILDVETAEENINAVDKANYELGYKLEIGYVSLNDNTGGMLNRSIFVNEKGYYQIPSNLIVKQIILYDGATATIDYLLEYNLIEDDVAVPDAYEATETIIGQISGKWNPDTNIKPIIESKYAAYDNNEYAEVKQTVDVWKAISFDMTPYSIIDIKFVNDPYSSKRIVGRTGILTLEPTYPTDLCIIRGKRMVEAPEERSSFLDDWEYVLDQSVYEASFGDEVSGTSHWWLLNTGNFENKMQYLLVKTSLNQAFNDTEIRAIIKDWHELDSKDFFNKYETKEPQINTVYGLINDMGFFEYKIYYQDYGWYDVVFPNKKQEDYSIIHAKVPVYGMINYKTNILKQTWFKETQRT